MTKPSTRTIIENAISKADSSYFFENYTKQANAVLSALEKAGYRVVPTDFPDTVWAQAANEMRTGRVKPEEHVKDVYQTVLRVMAKN